MNIYESWIVNKRIARRGLVDDNAPENTLTAFQSAIDNGYAIEIDVRTLDDGTAIVFHDDKLSRMTNRDGYVSTLKIEDLAGIMVGKSTQHIPTLKEVLAFIDGKTPILIKIINDSKVGALERTIGEMLNKYNGEFAVESFNPYVLEFYKNNFPQFYRGQVSGNFRGIKSVGFFKRGLLSRMKFNKHISCPNFISYDFRALPNPYVATYRKTMPVIAWAIKNMNEFARVKNMCDNIIFEKFAPLADASN